MANAEHLAILLSGTRAWNVWRQAHPEIEPDLSGADLREAELSWADLRRTRLTGALLKRANLSRALLCEARLEGANLRKVLLIKSDLSGAHLNGADLTRADLTEADLSRAFLSGTILKEALLVNAILDGCYIYGVSAWEVRLDGAIQTNLRITPPNEPAITVDNLEAAQFVYLLMHNQRVGAALDTITSKVVLLLGRFSKDRKLILDALREALKSHPNGYVPVLFDSEKQHNKPVLETVKILANLARFVIADLTDAHMVGSELTYITMTLPAVPIQPLIEGEAELPGEYGSWALHPFFEPVYRYTDIQQLLANLDEAVIAPVEQHIYQGT